MSGQPAPKEQLVKTSLALLSAALCLSLGACDWMKKKDGPQQKSEKELAAEAQERLRKACASEATYARLKELVFDEAARVRNADPRQLDPIAAASVVRMEEPVVKSRDEELNVTVCSGRFFLEVPPGAENAFDGMRRISADVQYAAQAAADGSGLVYHMEGAEPIIYRLATIGMNGQPLPRMAQAPEQPELAQVTPPQTVPPPAMPAPPAEPAPAEVTKAPAPPPVKPKPAAKPERPPVAVAAGEPSFPCRYARSPSEKMVCSSPGLANKDRQMASIYYAAMAGAPPATRAHLRRSRDTFLVRRDRCGTEACVAAVYNARISEIRSITDGR
jgi:alkylhydroperoxidase/carboxymuconolactone decarboxylase family protein YurZ